MPEQTQTEDLSDASFLGKLLVLPANVRLDWKIIARYTHSSLFDLVFCNEEKKFYNVGLLVEVSSRTIAGFDSNSSLFDFKENQSNVIFIDGATPFCQLAISSTVSSNSSKD